MAPPAKPQTPRGPLGRVVVIGGNGFLGHHIVNQALSASWLTTSVSSVDLRCDRNRNRDAAYYECDITDRARLQSLLEDLKPDVVIHTASPLADAHRPNKDLYKKVNIDGTASVVAACQHAGVKALVYTSSASVVSDGKTPLANVDERWPVLRGAAQPEYYSETKAAAEELVLAANRQDPYSLLTASLRPAGIFGDGDVQLLAGVVQAHLDGRSGIQVGPNTNIFDFTYVGNVAHAHLLAANLLLITASSEPVPDSDKVDGEAFFITNDAPCYFWDLMFAMWRAAGKETGSKGMWRISQDMGYILAFFSEIAATLSGKRATFTRLRVTYFCLTRYYNIAKAKRVLGYEPLWTLQEGVNTGVSWYMDQDKTKKAAKAQ